MLGDNFMSDKKHKMSIQSIESPEGSLLRKEFDAIKLPLGHKSIKLEEGDPEEIRQDNTPTVSIQIMKDICRNPVKILAFEENIYTNSRFISDLESFIRKSAVDVKGLPGHEDRVIPEPYSEYFRTDFDKIPADVVSRPLYVIYAEDNPLGKVGGVESFSVDYDSSWTLKMVPPSIMNAKLLEIERKSSFSAVIRSAEKVFEPKGNIRFNTDLLGHETRRDHYGFTVSHYVFRDEEEIKKLV